ncbi:hypothetical protein RQ832_31515, partial [Roseomonas sp. DSM 102946]|nr:hypothetical protein [Roseomonas sp. DSM 102946]
AVPADGIFLISLKAGGVGLNLTAADPWRNPALEDQSATGHTTSARILADILPGRSGRHDGTASRWGRVEEFRREAVRSWASWRLHGRMKFFVHFEQLSLRVLCI